MNFSFNNNEGNDMSNIPFYQRPIVLQVEGLVKKYGSRTVVNGVSFQVHQGEVVGLLGSNGAGKTTSFRMACGLIPLDAGRVWIDGIDVTDWPMYRRAKEGKMGYLPQDRSVFGALTTEKNLTAIMELLGYDRATQRKMSQELMEMFNLIKVRHTIVGAGGTGGLSGGERRRLEIARALLPNPKILLLDEPFANVDPKTVMEIQGVIQDLSARGIAVLITDHQVVETLEITNRSYVIHDGKVLCFGTPDEVLTNPEAQKCYFGEKAAQQRMRVNNSASQNEPNSAISDNLKDNSKIDLIENHSATERIDSSQTKARTIHFNSVDSNNFDISSKNQNELKVNADNGYVVPDDVDFTEVEFRTDETEKALTKGLSRLSPQELVERTASVPRKPSLNISPKPTNSVQDSSSQTSESESPHHFISKFGNILKRKNKGRS